MSYKILLVDDDLDFRVSLKDTLLLEDFEVIEADNGFQAIKELNKGDHIDLIISDVLMPECDGVELMKNIRKEYPNIKMISISGGGRLGDTDYLKSISGLYSVKFLKKPFQRADLLKTIQELLAN